MTHNLFVNFDFRAEKLGCSDFHIEKAIEAISKQVIAERRAKKLVF